MIFAATLLALPLIYLSFSMIQAIPKSLDAGDDSSYGAPVHLADLEDRSVKESSGIAASRRHTNVFWTHNDSGDGPFIYAVDREGKQRGVWRVTGAQARDWEDIAIGPGPVRDRHYLYIGDIGDNSKKRDHIIVYRVIEPQVASAAASSTKKSAVNTAAADAIRLKYPDGSYDAEALMVHPTTGDLYVVTKVMGGAAGVFSLKAPFPKTGISTLARVGEVRFPNPLGGFITGGDISPDGRRVVLCDYLGAVELVLPDSRGTAFDSIWKESLAPVNIGSRRQGEAICYRADGLALLATSEGLPCPLIEVARQSSRR
ncbi:MAG TPA: hypothetical protein VFQ92_00670 [Blastocatellia bacterium]|nr:hypothetical protein [Blastocatellia bacterium]